jgi:hypothetical protein
MEINKFIEKHPFVYHLTNKNNLQQIINCGSLFSTNYLIDKSKKAEYLPIKRQKRPKHYELEIDGVIYFIRDQQPISEKALSKCLTHNWICADFYEHLNNRVFMWPNLDRLWRHFNRYKNENPIILRFDTFSILQKNKNAKFCRLNSGATRANSFLGGKPPARGIDTFQSAEEYTFSISSVAEVTFENECIMPEIFYYSNSPDGIWELIELV